MSHSKNLSELLNEADSLEAAMVALVKEFPDLGLEALFAAERAEVVEIGWSPSSRHRDCSHLVALTEILRPIASQNANLSIVDAFKSLIGTNHPHEKEIAKALKES